MDARPNGRVGHRLRGALIATVALTLLVGCGGSGKTAATTTTAMHHEGGSRSVPAGENACPVEGCKVTITKVVRHGGEVQVTWHANYTPDASRNHIHVYWDIYTADQVSNDAASRGVKQGEWVPTDAYPVYVTGGAVAVAKRGRSTTLCVTAGDGDHNVIDSSLKDCRSVANLL